LPGGAAGPTVVSVTAASATLALLLAQRAFSGPPPVRPQDDPAFATTSSQAQTQPQAQPQAQAPQDPSAAASGTPRSDATASGGEGLRRAQDEVNALRGEMAGVQKELADTKAKLATESARAKQLEDQVAALQQTQAAQAQQQAQAAEQAAQSTQQRAQASAGATQALAGAQDALTRGDTSNVDAALVAQLQALEQTRTLATQQGASQEALRADAAARWIQAARDALARGDLAQARAAVAQAQAQAAGASALSGQGAGGTGTGSGAAPPTGGRMGY
jgi:hypothetical protein